MQRFISNILINTILQNKEKNHRKERKKKKKKTELLQIKRKISFTKLRSYKVTRIKTQSYHKVYVNNSKPTGIIRYLVYPKTMPMEQRVNVK